jgi:hypothetical protein
MDIAAIVTLAESYGWQLVRPRRGRHPRLVAPPGTTDRVGRAVHATTAPPATPPRCSVAVGCLCRTVAA